LSLAINFLKLKIIQFESRWTFKRTNSSSVNCSADSFAHLQLIQALYLANTASLGIFYSGRGAVRSCGLAVFGGFPFEFLKSKRQVISSSSSNFLAIPRRIK
jgi:hypothetical protein